MSEPPNHDTVRCDSNATAFKESEVGHGVPSERRYVDEVDLRQPDEVDVRRCTNAENGMQQGMYIVLFYG